MNTQDKYPCLCSVFVCKGPMSLQTNQFCRRKCPERAFEYDKKESELNRSMDKSSKHKAPAEFVHYDDAGGVTVDLAGYLQTPQGQAQLDSFSQKNQALANSRRAQDE